MLLPVPIRLPVRVGAQRFAYELRAPLGDVPHGARYVAADVTSEIPADPWAARPVELHATVLSPTDAGHTERLTLAVERFRYLNHPHLLTVHALGAVEDGPAGGTLVLTTEPWAETLADVVARDRALTEGDLLAVFDAVSGGLFALHEAGYAHGDLSPQAVVRTAAGWKLALGHPARGAQDDLPTDIAAAGALFRVGLGAAAPRPLATPTPLPAPTTGSGVVGWFKQMLAAEPPAAAPRARPIPPPLPGTHRLAVPPVGHIPPAWEAVLAGCGHPDPARRWRAERLVFGAPAPPVVAELSADATTANAFRLTWTAAEGGRVGVCDVGDHVPASFGTVAGAAVLRDLNWAAPPGTASGTTVQLTGETRRLQAVTVLDERRVVVFGPWVDLTRVPNVFNLRIRASRLRLHLTWDWPLDVHLAYVVVREDRYPSSADDGHAIVCLRTSYEANGRFEQPSPARGGGVFVSVFVGVRVPGGMRYSPGTRARLARAPLHLHYSVRRAAGGCELVLTPNRPGELPELVLVAGHAQMPRSACEGTTVARVPPDTRCAPDQPAVIGFDPPALDRWKARLFSLRNDDYDWLELTSDSADGVSVE